MPYCKFCHHEISKFDRDVCPFCGGVNPIDSEYKTMDVTRQIGKIKDEVELYKSKSHLSFSLYAMFLGMFGVHNFYIKKTKLGIINLITSFLFEISLGLILYFTGAIKNALAFLLPFLILFLFYLIVGLIYLKKDSLKDGEGEFLR
ncbi:MAG TPA: hypothetical protein DEF61_04330 [Firmicutes bacterium]|nr:hypothetical protein [Bacillota bacterium]HBX25468.1 hypothetical protein [Bacillota bacterium]